ncbi:MAG: hypothetical protein AB7T49_17080 [Oligoflexales bacterium]
MEPLQVDPVLFISISYGLALALLAGTYTLLQRQQKKLQRIYASIRDRA